MPLLDRLFGDPPAPVRRIRIPDRPGAVPPMPFLSRETYFQVGVAQVHIQKLQAFLKDFSPLVYSHLRYQVGSRHIETTFVIDPRQDKTAAAGRLSIGYTPIATPIPFVNDDIRLEIALFRLEVADYMPAAVGLLTSIASAVLPDFKMSDKIAKTLTKGVDDLLKDKSSFVVGWSGSLGDSEPLAPGYVVITNDTKVDRTSLLVVDGTLKVGDEPESAIPFAQGDFLMFRIDSRASRTDFLTVEPIATLYEKALRAIADNHADGLTESLADLRRSVMSASAFTLPDAKRIVTALTLEIRDRWEGQKAETVSFKARLEANAPILKEVSEAEFAAAMTWIPQEQ